MFLAEELAKLANLGILDHDGSLLGLRGNHIVNRQARGGGNSNCRWEGILIVADQPARSSWEGPGWLRRFQPSSRITVWTVKGSVITRSPCSGSNSGAIGPVPPCTSCPTGPRPRTPPLQPCRPFRSCTSTTTSPTWRITLRDLWKWWKVRKPQLRALLILGLILMWMSLALWQAERRSQAAVREVRQNLEKQESTRHSHFARLLGTEEQPFQHVAPCIIMSQGNGLRPSKLPRQGCIPRHVLVPLPALGPMPVPTLVVPGSSTVLRDSSLSHVSWSFRLRFSHIVRQHRSASWSVASWNLSWTRRLWKSFSRYMLPNNLPLS